MIFTSFALTLMLKFPGNSRSHDVHELFSQADFQWAVFLFQTLPDIGTATRKYIKVLNLQKLCQVEPS